MQRLDSEDSLSRFERGMSRRSFVIAAAGGLAVAAGCSRIEAGTSPMQSAGHSSDALPPLEVVERVESRRASSGRTVTASLTAQPSSIDLGGPIARTVAYGSELSGPLVRANVGDELVVDVANHLDRATSVHWHGVAMRNDMDGAAPATPDIEAGQRFVYRFKVPHAGTYWAHPHTGLDPDRGLYIPVIFDDPREPAYYDAEWIIVLDDWTDGVGPSPDEIFAKLRSGDMSAMPGHSGMGDMPGHSGMGDMPGHSGMGDSDDLLGGDPGDVTYPYFLVNGRIPDAPTSFAARPGDRVRLRIINAGADTAFRVALAGHKMTITHTDGFPVQPVQADAVLLGMGERYDAIVTVGDGVFPLVASAEGKNGLARALLKTGSGSDPGPGMRPAELTGRVITAADLTAAPSVDLGDLASPTAMQVNLTGGMDKYDWGINGKQYPDTAPFAIREGENAIITFTNQTMMWHPMHLHGHTFQLINPDGTRGPRKDTVAVNPMKSVKVAVVADNPGTWMMHCHNIYHLGAGMMTTLDYVYN